MIPIEERCRVRDTHAFVSPDTFEALADKIVGVIGEGRRMAKIHRYLGDDSPLTVKTGLTVAEKRGFKEPIERKHNSVSTWLDISLDPGIEGFGISADTLHGETESQIRDRYHRTDRRREEITYIEIDGFPGQPSRTDRIRIEYWNQHGVGQETLIAFDDLPRMVEIEPEIFERIDGMVREGEGIVPVSRESLVNMAVESFLEGAKR